MLIDEVHIVIKAGNGGDGKISFKRNGQTAKGGPDGGNGGTGGNVYFKGVDDVTALSVFRYKKEWSAEDGIAGGKQNLFGRKGSDLILLVPLGTHLIDLKSKEAFEISQKDQLILLAKGGSGGRGNNEFKSATNQTPREAENGEPGQERELSLSLRLIADVGLVGLPNAGKSSLLTAVTNARPRIGDYPFTTLEPNLGVLRGGLVIADIPGLIEGASKGKGLGSKFLKHIEKTKVLFHCIDATSKSVEDDYKTVRNEFEKFSTTLIQKKEVILITKCDLVNEVRSDTIIATLKKYNPHIEFVSVYDQRPIDNLIHILERMK